MKIQQLSVFLENRPGRLASLCRTLAEAGVDLMTLSLADAGEFGLLRILASDHDRAREVIEQAGYAAASTEVAAFQVPDHPGGLAQVLSVLEPHGIAIEYMYAFSRRAGDDAVMVFRFDDMDKAMALLANAGINAYRPVSFH